MNNYKYNNIKDKLNEIEKKNEDNANVTVIMACLLFIELILTIIILSFESELYNEFMPKECECNNELIIDTDTLTL